MKIYLILPAVERLRVTRKRFWVPKRKMLRFSVLSLTTVAALTPEEHEVVICDENVEPVDYQSDADVVGITFMTGLANRAYELAAHFKVPAMVCVNKYDLNPQQTEKIKRLAEEKKMVFLGKVPFDPVFTESMIQGKTIFEYNRESATSQTVHAIWKDLMSKI